MSGKMKLAKKYISYTSKAYGIRKFLIMISKNEKENIPAIKDFGDKRTAIWKSQPNADVLCKEI